MTTLLVAHGTRNPQGVQMIGVLAELMAQRLDERVHTAFVDVLGPGPAEVLGRLRDHRRVSVVPAFLSRGYHVHADLPDQLRAAGHPGAWVAEALGPSTELAEVQLDRLAEAGWRPGDEVVLAAAGSSDARACDDIRSAASRLSGLLGCPVHIAFAAAAPGAAYPAVAEKVAELRESSSRRVAVASYLLADGLFQQRLYASGADVVSAPLGLHPKVVDLACARASAAVAV